MNKDQIIADIESGNTALGIEYGSTRIKAVLVGSDNEPIAIGAFDWENSLVDGYWTYSDEEIFAGLAAAYASMKADVAEKYGVTLKRVGALGISAMMHGYLPFDADGNLLVPFRTWRNTTTTQAAHELSELFAFHTPGALERQPHLPGRPEQRVARSQHRVLHHPGRLRPLAPHGEKVLSIGDASGMFPIDSTTHDYDAAMIAKFDELVASKGVSWKVEDLLPKILVAGECAGHLTARGRGPSRCRRRPRAGMPALPARGRRRHRHDRHQLRGAAHRQRLRRHVGLLDGRSRARAQGRPPFPRSTS